MKNRLSAGFTLIEMSIVLLIIGLITGSIVLGRTLLVNSRLQTVMTDADSYITAIGNFKQQYQALPGDMNSATTNWGTDSNGCNFGGGVTGTCNGNGDGEIGGAVGSGNEFEVFRFWQHLYYAGMYSKLLTGIPASGTSYIASVGVDVAPGSIEGSGFSPVWEGTIASGNANFFYSSTSTGNNFYGNIFLFGSTNGSYITSGAAITPDQAASIDTKIDDGVPNTGNVRSFIPASTYAPNCTSGTSTYTYNTTNNVVACPLIFLTHY